jgi:chorismate synthase
LVKYTTAGESHGKALIAIVEGIPAGVSLSTEEIKGELARRRGGIGRGDRQKFEQDNVEILSGVIHGKTIASPIAIEIQNTEWPKWDQIMSTDPVSNDVPDQLQPNVDKGEEGSRLTKPRPGHADLEGIRKYGFSDARPVLERASARETAARVAAGSVAKAFIKQAFGIEVKADVVQFGNLHFCPPEQGSDGTETLPTDCGFLNCASTLEEFDNLASQVAAHAVEQGETVGGVVRIVANNVPPGLGSYISADARLDSALAGALMSIQAVKGVEIGDGFGIAGTPGSDAHDLITSVDGKRETNHAGGIEGGISNGQPVVTRIAIKPIPSVPGGLKTVNLTTGATAKGHSQRSDCSAVYPARVVAEAEVALVLANFITQRFGADTVPGGAK